MRWIGLVMCLASPAGAYTLGGGITASSGGGAFVKIENPDLIQVGEDTFQDDNLYAFDEDQNIRLPRDIHLDIGGVIEEGTIVASHYVFFDPDQGTRQIGWVEFDAPVLGMAVNTWTLAETDFLANTSVVYLNPSLRGLEGEDAVWIDPQNPFRIRVDWAASSPGDYIRVFTGQSPGV